MNRRNFIAYNSFLGLSYLSNNLVFSDIKSTDENSVIYLFLNGGATHIETFNPCPNAPSEIRSVTGHIQTSIPGEYIGGLHTEVAKRTNKIAIVRSFNHKDSNHRSAQHLNLTGGKTIGDGPQTTPSYGAFAAYKFGPNNKGGLPTYIKLNSHPHTAASSLGQKFAGYDSSPKGLGDLSLKTSVERLNKRRRMLSIVDNNSLIKESQIAQDYAELREQAISSLTGNIADIFDIEKDKEYQKFKDNSLGNDLLKAVRLVEAGSKFVFLSTGGWDMHSNILTGLNSRQVTLDQYIAKTIDSLYERGLSKKTLFVVSTEFGRTYKINVNGGRDHNPRNIPLMLYCDSYDMGRIIGKTNDTASEVIESPFNPDDLTNTILSHLGFKKNERWVGLDGRPHDFISSSSKNILYS